MNDFEAIFEKSVDMAKDLNPATKLEGLANLKWLYAQGRRLATISPYRKEIKQTMSELKEFIEKL